MDKWRNKKRPVFSDSLLPPTLRPRPPQERPNSKKWSIDNFFKMVSVMLDAQSSSSDEQTRKKPIMHRKKTKNPTQDGQGILRPAKSKKTRHSIATEMPVNINQSDRLQDVSGGYSRSSDGSLDAFGRKVRMEKMKARVEAKRDQMCGDSSMDESSVEENGKKVESSKRRSRASRTERYMKRLCNGNVVDSKENDPVPYPIFSECLEPINCSAAAKLETVDNPLVRQTLQYFSDYHKAMAEKDRKRHPNNDCNTIDDQYQHWYPVENQHQSAYSEKYQSPHLLENQNTHVMENVNQNSNNSDPPILPPRKEGNLSPLMYVEPPLNNHQVPNRAQSSPISYYGSLLEDYQGRSHPSIISTSPYSMRSDNYFDPTNSPVSVQVVQKYFPLPSPPPSPPPTPPPSIETGSISISPESKPYFSRNLPNSTKESPLENDMRHNSKNLEEALIELEAIYNSLELGDEELLDRAEQRSIEEFQYKGFSVSPSLDIDEELARRRTWVERSHNEESEIPHRLKDDMAYRRMHPKERSLSLDGQNGSLSNISYLVISPLPTRRNLQESDSKRKEPDIALDDVVFRSRKYANNILKVLDPQPPFGIPIGPVSGSTDSDYLHSNPKKSEYTRSMYVKPGVPDVVTDDLAFRNLRKDTATNKGVDSFIKSPVPRNIATGEHRRRASRSLSSNLHGYVNKPYLIELDRPSQRGSPNSLLDSRSSEYGQVGDLMPNLGWQKTTWDNLDINRNQPKENYLQKLLVDGTKTSDIDVSNRSNDSSDEPILPVEQLKVQTISLPPNNDSPTPNKNITPFTEQEISVYSQLCQDLENLVQMTKNINEDTALTSVEQPNISLPATPKAEEEDIKVLTVDENEKSCNEVDFKHQNASKGDESTVQRDDILPPPSPETIVNSCSKEVTKESYESKQSAKENDRIAHRREESPPKPFRWPNVSGVSAERRSQDASTWEGRGFAQPKGSLPPPGRRKTNRNRRKKSCSIL